MKSNTKTNKKSVTETCRRFSFFNKSWKSCLSFFVALFILSNSFPIGPIVSFAAADGTFEVHVKDSDSNPLAGATVILTDNVATGSISITTDSSGIASFTSGLDYSHEYVLHVELDSTYSIHNAVMTISAGQTLEVTLTRQLRVTTSVALSSPAGSGSITLPQTVGKGSSAFVAITANPGFVISSLTDNGAEISDALNKPAHTINFTSIAVDHAIIATFEVSTNKMTVSKTGSGQITVAGTAGITAPAEELVPRGDSKSYTITPDAGNKIKSITVDTALIESDTRLTRNTDGSAVFAFTGITAPHTLIVEFEKSFIITVTSPTDGKITVNGSTVTPGAEVSVAINGSIAFTMTPASGHILGSLLVDTTTIPAGNSSIAKNGDGSSTYTFANVTAEHSIAATFEDQKLDIIVAPTTYGTITSVGPTNIAGTTQQVVYGQDISITVKPKSGQDFKSLLVDNAPILEGDSRIVQSGTSYTYTFSNVKVNHSIGAVFADQTFNITVEPTDNGIITIDGTTNIAGKPQTVIFDHDIAFKMKPDTGYLLNSLLVDGKAVSAADLILLDNGDGTFTYTFSHVQKVHSIKASFTIQKIDIDIVEATNGSITVNGTSTPANTNQKVDYGSDISLTFTPSNAYTLVSLKVDDVELLPDGSGITDNQDDSYTLTLSDVTKLHNVAAIFEGIQLLTVDETATYTITAATVPTQDLLADGTRVFIYQAGTKVTFTPKDPLYRIALNPGYKPPYKTSADVISSKYVSSIYFKKDYNRAFGMNMEPIQIIIDGTNPQIGTTITKTPSSAWTNGPVLIEGTATDTDATDTDGKGLDGAGLEYVYYSTDKTIADNDMHASAKTGVGIANLTPTGAFSIQVSGTPDFSGNYYIWAYDRSYNKSAVKSVEVNIETVKPTIETITSTQTTPWTNQAVTVDVTADDLGGSGLSVVRYSTDASLANSDTPALSVTGVDTAVLSNGKYSFTVDNLVNFEGTYYIWAYDQAGNKSTVGEIDTIRIDVVQPVVTSVTKNPASEWSTGAVTISAVCSDDKSGIERVVCSPHSNFDIVYPMVASTDGLTYTYTTDGSEYNANYYVRVYDNAANDSMDIVNKTDESTAISIDTTDPVITNFEITKTDMSVPARIINFLTFGTFFNSSVKVTVTAADAGISSGITKITLNRLAADGSVISSIYSATLTDNKYTFTISPESAGKLSAVAVDKSGRISAAKSPSQVSGGITNDSLVLSTTAPVIQITPDAGVFTDAANRVWYPADAGFAISVSDDYGIKTVTASINGIPLTNDCKGKSITSDFSLSQTLSQSFSLSTSQGTIAADGHYTIDVSVTDVNGNVASSSSTVYKDVTDPAIKGFVFTPADGISIEAALVESADYGYYFVKDTVATISSADLGPSSGVKSITYYTVDCSNSAAGVQSQEKTVIVDGSNCISVTIPANFKGQIYAKANDQVGNISDSFAKPNGAVVEDAGQHAATSAIFLSAPETPYKDNDGLALYQNNVSVDVKVGDSYSGIRQIEWSVTAAYDTANNQSGSISIDNNGTVTGDASAWSTAKKDINLVTEMTRAITVANNSNAVRIYVKLTDRAGNVSEKNIVLSIDKTQPTIQVTYNNNAYNAAFAGEAQYYKADRTATIVVTERNFDASKVATAITNTDTSIPGLSGWTEAKNTTDPDMTTHTATITYSADGDYTFDLDLSDRAGLKNADLAIQKFTIDKTIPTVQVSYDNTDAKSSNYYNKERTATITIKEHNFETGNIVITGTASNDGSPAVFPKVSSWSTSGDTHTATIKYSSDALYSFDISYTDKALNATEDFAAHSFYIDLTAPSITITGVKDKSANNGDVIPVITFSDVNFDKDAVKVTLSGANRGNVTTDGKYSTIKNGETYTFANFEKAKEIDDLYTLTANIVDTAGNKTTKVITFSVNRFGSVYSFDNTLKKIEGKYVQTGIDVVLTETNVDELEAKNTNLKITKNGESRDLVEGTDYTISHNGGNGQWNQYTYVLGASLFSDDGKYIVTLYTKDAAGNINENIDESKKAEIWFGVDKTLPVILATDLSANSTYALNSKTVSSNVSDNLVLESVQIFLNGQEIKYTVENDRYTFEIPSSNISQTIRILATDSAGNVSTQEIKNFYVTTNLFVRWYTNTPLLVGSIAGFVLVIGALVYIFIYPRPRRRAKK